MTSAVADGSDVSLQQAAEIKLTGRRRLAEFICGYVVAVVSLAPVVYLVIRRHRLTARRRTASKGRQLEELSRLTGGLAHEIKNPLSTIKVNLKLITEDVLEANQQDGRWFRKIEVVEKETARLEQILEDFLRYIGKTEIRPERADVNALMGDMVDFYLPQAQAHKVTLRASLSPDSLLCRIDGDMIKQVVLNLFINATQAMPDGGDLIVRTAGKSGNAVIEISDTGLGIEQEKLDRIFEAYYTTRPGGSGLGLPTARKIIEAHKGQLTANSQPGTGTSFCIEIPLEK